MKAEDVMTRGVISVKADTPVLEIAHLLLDKHISGVPVLDAADKLIGIVSEGDLLRRVEMGTEKKRARWMSFFTNEITLADEFVKSHGLKARDVMTTSVFTIDRRAPLSEIVDVMESRGVKRIPVVENGHVVGMVTRGNLMRALIAARPAAASDKPANDAAIRAKLIAELDRHPWGHRHESSIIVKDGVVHLWGAVSSESEANALRVTAEGVAGVARVVDHTVVSVSVALGQALVP